MTAAAASKTVGILGGGISGLSTAYYLRKKFGDAIKPIIFERSNKCGGWVKTISRTDGSDKIHYEQGPRSVRPAGVSGMNTLDLIEELGLSAHVVYVKRDHPAAKTRFIYMNDKLVKLPQDFSVLFKKTAPFDRALIFAVFRDLYKWRKKAEDDSIHEFVKRRFGNDMATYLIDPLIRGICAGDSKQISVKFLMKTLFEYEQKYGSAFIGLLLGRFKKEDPAEKAQSAGIGYSNIALASLEEGWAVWSLEGGLSTLPWMMEDHLLKLDKDCIQKNCAVKSIRLGEVATGDSKITSNKVEIEYNPENDEKQPKTLVCDHIISTIPAFELGKILRHSRPAHPTLWKVFDSVESTNVQVTNVMYKKQDILEDDAFGFLVPSVEKSVQGLLGVVFDTCCFPQADRTILTVMSKPLDGKENDQKKILGFLDTTLKIKQTPDDYYSEVLYNCIPQYGVGHYEKVDGVRRLIKAGKLPITLAGASYDGVSVNDSIFSGKLAAENFDKIEEVEK